LTDRRDALRAALGRVGVWSFALQGHGAAEEQAAVAAYEALGFRSTWIPESVGSKEAFAHAAVLLAASPRMIVGTGIASIYARDPMAMANGARTLGEAYPGRFVLGIGVSHAPSVASRGSVYERPIERMIAYLDAMDAAAYAAPAPAVPVPVVLAALGPRMLELAAERTAGAHPYFVPVEHTMMARERLGKDPLLIVEQAAVLDTDRARARETAHAFAGRYLAAENYANNLRRLGWGEDDIAGGGSDRLVDALVVQGNAGAIVGRVREHLDAGADNVCVQLRAPDPADLCLSAFGELRAALGDLVDAAVTPG
jgi:probable F420-dependent oxidoreductase